MAGTDHPRLVDPTGALELLARLSPRDLSTEGLLQTVAGLTRSAMPGDVEASVTLLVRGRPATVGSTARLATDLDGTQYDRGHGPCLHAARTGEVTEVRDTRTDERWPDYLPRAVEAGNLSSLSLPLAVDPGSRVTGALNVYARRPDAFDERSRSIGARFAPYVAVAAGNLHAYRTAREMAGNLQVALESRAVIDQAKGILMERHRLTADQAFDALARVSMRTNRKVRDVADHLVATGEILCP